MQKEQKQNNPTFTKKLFRGEIVIVMLKLKNTYGQSRDSLITVISALIPV